MAQEVCVMVGAEDRARLAAVVCDRRRSLKHVQRARFVLLSAERLPVLEVARRAGVSRPAVWRWQRRYGEEGLDGLLRDKTRPPDEKSQIQALDRTQPGLPLKPGKCGTMTHDYKRHGTTTLFASLDVLDGKVI